MTRIGTIFIAAAALLFTAVPSSACSSVVISGKVTPDGRPLLWKHRDSDYLQNSVKFFKGEKYSFIAIVNSVEDNPTDVWMGVNSAGFAIMNTQSFNLVDVAPGEERGAANGRIMRRALEICATVEDFHHFLDTLAKPSMIEASLGVIDAQGGAQMLEVDYYKYVVYDANDPAVAPHGYVARTNFSFTGDVNEGLGQVRYLIEEGLLMPGSGMGLFTPQWILTDVARAADARFRYGTVHPAVDSDRRGPLLRESDHGHRPSLGGFQQA